MHAEVIIEECEVRSCRAAKTPGVQEAVVDGREKGGIEMNDHEKTRFLGVAARINYLATDRSDLQHAAEEVCRKIAKPEPKDWDKARRIARYLQFSARGVLEFPFEQRNEKFDGFADRDWAGERPSMKSTSGCALKWGREHSEIVVEHADYNGVDLGRGGTQCHEQVRPTDSIVDKYRQ